MTLSDEQRKNVCKPGTLECCRYLAAGADGFCCLKLTTFKTVLDARVEAGTIRAVKDNCEGMLP